MKEIVICDDLESCFNLIREADKEYRLRICSYTVVSPLLLYNEFSVGNIVIIPYYSVVGVVRHTVSCIQTFNLYSTCLLEDVEQSLEPLVIAFDHCQLS